MIKDHSITVQLATEAKKLMLQELRADGEHSAAAYLKSSHFPHKWTLVEMNDVNFLSHGAPAGGVPCQSNAIERSNLEQKLVREFKRSAIVDFVTQVHRRRRCPLALRIRHLTTHLSRAGYGGPAAEVHDRLIPWTEDAQGVQDQTRGG